MPEREKRWSKTSHENKNYQFCFQKAWHRLLIFELKKSVYDQYPEAVFLVMCDPPMNEL